MESIRTYMLRLADDTPCQRAMSYYFERPNYKRFPRKPRMTLPVKIDEDLKECAKTKHIHVKEFKTLGNLNSLRDIAKDRKKWKQLVDDVCRR